MKFKCESYLLQAACLTVSRAVAAKSALPALEGLLLSAGDELRITGYDLKKGIYTSMEAEVSERGAVVVNARLFGEMIRRLPDGMVSISSDENNNVKVKCGKTEFNFSGIAAEDYPEMPVVEGSKAISVPQKLLKSMIEQTLFAVSTDDSRPIHTGTLFEISGDELTLVSVDGYRLAKRTEKLEGGEIEAQSFVVPGAALSDVERVCGDEGSAEISVGARHISFVIGGTVVVSRRLEGEFLNYKKAIPEVFKYQLKLDRGELLSVIDRVSLIVSEKNKSPVRMSFGDGVIDCLCYTPVGRAEDVCSCQGSGEGLQIGFNDRYMKEALKAAGTEGLFLCINSASSPCVIKADDGSDSFTFMILPVRLRAE